MILKTIDNDWLYSIGVVCQRYSASSCGGHVFINDPLLVRWSRGYIYTSSYFYLSNLKCKLPSTKFGEISNSCMCYILNAIVEWIMWMTYAYPISLYVNKYTNCTTSSALYHLPYKYYTWELYIKLTTDILCWEISVRPFNVITNILQLLSKHRLISASKIHFAQLFVYVSS